jgi:hypothetical protein
MLSKLAATANRVFCMKHSIALPDKPVVVIAPSGSREKTT